MENLLAFPGEVFPINARHDSVLGYQTWASLKALAKPVDLVVIATPAAQVPEIIRDCVACGVRAAIIISAGFKETGAAGASLESSVCEEIQHHGLRLIGPNCLASWCRTSASTPPLRRRWQDLAVWLS
jgi:acetyltransferase